MNYLFKPKSQRRSYQRFYCRLFSQWSKEYLEEWKDPELPCPHCHGTHVRKNDGGILGSGGLLPTNLGLITNEVEKFLTGEKDGKRIVLLDGLEYLVAQNGFGKVLKLLSHLSDTMEACKGVLLIPFNINSIEEREAAMLEADFEVV